MRLIVLATVAVVVDAFGGSASWQRRLDRALLDVDATPRQRWQNLRKVAEDRSAVVADVREAVRLLRAKDKTAAVETLFPTGTIARGDLEGLRKLRRQVPEALRAPPPRPPATTPADLRAAARSIAAAVAGLRDESARSALADEVADALRSTPKNLETPAYAVERAVGDAEIRTYAPYAVAEVAAAGPGEGFNALAAFLFGANAEARAMAMTTPVETAPDGTMAFVLPAKDAAAPPTPDDPAVAVARRGAKTVAVVSFPGLATPEEVARQRARLAAAVATDAALALDAENYAVLQYNAPFTLPWRRRNEVVAPVAVAAPPADAAVPYLDTLGRPGYGRD